MSKKNRNTKRLKKNAAESRLGKQSAPSPQLAPQPARVMPQQKTMALVINAPVIQAHVLEQIKMTIASGTPCLLYPLAPEYSMSMKPLMFGEALGLIPNEHGQLSLAVYTHSDPEQGVDYKSSGWLVEEFEIAVQKAWHDVYYAVWVQDDEQPEVEQPDAVAEVADAVAEASAAASKAKETVEALEVASPVESD